MSRVLAKIQRLIALAANDSAEVAEARTAAHIAARLIHAHRIELHDPVEQPLPARPTRIIRSRYVGRCSRCGRVYEVGDLVAWTRGLGAAHEKCA